MEQQEPKRDADRTIRSILNAAEKEFAARGFSGARVDVIAAAAGINKATIYYHIGNKHKLYLEVIQRLIRGLTDQLDEQVQATEDPKRQLSIYIRSVVAGLTSRANLAPILLREFASGARSFPEELGDDLARLYGIVAGILERGQRTGVFVTGSPFVVHFMVMGFSLMFRMTEPVRSHVPRLKKLFAEVGSPDPEVIVSELEERVFRSICAQTDANHPIAGGQS